MDTHRSDDENFTAALDGLYGSISAMRPSAEFLSEAELDTLSEFLDSVDTAMDIERFDGFLCALVAGPDMVMPSEYWPIVLGRDPAATETFRDLAQAQEILGLVMKHWNGIATRLHSDEIYAPIILEDDTGLCGGRDWALGFMQGVDLHAKSWAAFLADDNESGAIFPMLALAHENHPDKALRFESPSKEKREELLCHMTAGLLRTYRYFKARRAPSGVVRHSSKQGRNDPCNCGSGKKYKQCCLRKVH